MACNRRATQTPYIGAVMPPKFIHAPPASVRPPLPRLTALCLASPETAWEVRGVIAETGGSTVRVSTVADAQSRWDAQDPTPFNVVVTALGTDDSTRVLARTTSGFAAPFCTEAVGDSRVLLVIYSHTACAHPATRDRCLADGAYAVVNSRAELAAVLRAARGAAPRPAVPVAAEGMTAARATRTSGESQGQEYPPLARRRARLRALHAAHAAGRETGSDVEEVAEVTEALAKQLAALGGEVVVRLRSEPVADTAVTPSSVPTNAGGSAGGVDSVTSGAGTDTAAADASGRALRKGDNERPKTVVRVVHVSDTHGHHDRIVLPHGDLLLHTGDITGNYGRCEDLAAEFESFVRWVDAAAGRFRHVVFIAGNHDTFLDGACYDGAAVDRAHRTLKRLLARRPNVHYLQNSGVTLLGLTIWGSPVVPSRVELANKRFYSDAFERISNDRRVQFATIPDGLDILMTHGPPQILAHPQQADSVLEAALLAKAPRDRPRLHLFGHAHDYFGVCQVEHRTEGSHGSDSSAVTVCMNAAQAWVVGADPCGGGTPLECLVEVAA